ncbi:LacI family DNA-binding transcriptional regulator [Ruania halotolerans]|uniref:LacI family DNA-binding transcriptional regulator n=1 Tax=Ruania halotolerans TaxID=2897773 RepID=UPI001E3EB9E4|nr:LacI family DNA-binding transcriptional regulator [Ruania halotolerans]UFU06981.1 LacI family transcriptional regulator [Ruania halotolerans]
MTDVGRAAGVSAQTVSRYFTGRGYVSEAARARIQRAVDELGYRPNRLARNLHLPGSDTIGVLTSGSLNFGAAQTLTGMFAAAHEADVSLIVAHLDAEQTRSGDAVRQTLERMLSMRVDGVIVSARGQDVEEIVDILAGDVPHVIVGGARRAAGHYAVADSFAAGRVATEHLLGLGHRTICFVTGPEGADESRERELGFREALAEAGLPPGRRVVGGDWTSAAGHRAGIEADLEGVTAVFTANDELALGFMAARRDRGEHAPGDYAIVGIDDMPEASYFAPALTTVRLDFEALGRGAVEMIRRQGQDPGETGPLVVPPSLVVRRSTAAP